MTRIRELREKRGLEQKQLASELNVSQPTISDWETGRKTPSARSTAKIADYFGVTMDYLLCRSDDPPAQSTGGLTTESVIELSEDSEMFKEIWDQLGPEARKEVLKFAKYQRSEQNQR